MKKILSVCFAIIIAVSAFTAGTVNAAPVFKDEPELAREVILAERRLAVYRVLTLTDTEKAGFWPIYDQYISEKKKIGDRMVALIRERSLNDKNMSDEAALKMLDDLFSIESDILKIEMDYAKKFQKVIPGVKVVRFFQIENKLDAQRDLNLAVQIPLVGSDAR